jgi:integrase
MRRRKNSLSLVPDLPLDAFRRHLQSKRGTGSHVELTMSQLKAIFKHCKFDTIDSLRNSDAANIANQFLKNKKRESKRVQLKPDRKRERTVIYSNPEKLEPISAWTHNSYIISLKAFCKWCCTTRPIPDCPLIYGLELARQTDKQTRRAATDDEMDRILSAALNGAVVADLSGEQRYYLYLTAISTGFRASELRSLCRADFNLKSQIPHILMASKNSKNRKETQQPIHAQTASELAAWIKGKPAKQPLWPG